MLITTSEIIEQSLDNYARTWRKFAPLMAILIAIVALRYVIGIGGIFLNADTKLSTALIDLVSAILLFGLFFIGFWTSIVATKNSAILYTQGSLSTLKKSFLDTKKYLLPIIGVSILYAIICMVGSVLLLLPGLIFGIWYYLATFAVIFDNNKILESLKTSKNLVIGRWWSMAFRIVTPKILLVIALVIIKMLCLTALNQIFKPSDIQYEMMIQIINGIVTALTLPIFIWTDTLLYFSAKENPLQPITTIK